MQLRMSISRSWPSPWRLLKSTPSSVQQLSLIAYAVQRGFFMYPSAYPRVFGSSRSYIEQKLPVSLTVPARVAVAQARIACCSVMRNDDISFLLPIHLQWRHLQLCHARAFVARVASARAVVESCRNGCVLIRQKIWIDQNGQH